MSKRIRAHIQNNVYGLIAIFIALGGTAYATNGSLAGTNTVGSADIINEDVTNADIAPTAQFAGAVAGGELEGTYPNPTLGTVAELDVTGNAELGDSLSDLITMEGNVRVKSAVNQSNAMEIGGAEVWSDGDHLNTESSIEANGVVSGTGLVAENSPLNLNDNSIDFTEDSTAPPGFSNGARLFVRDNGSGKTQLVVQFPTGSAVVLATQP